ncbi:bcl-2-like protein 1 [Bubalus kerabau]|uniref:bcl-2-like protein 1 n=1 Tax=Bubalus bubalis TaxID=89462 RepID=UPI001D113DCF|nr:bcl-2-like protein 1 [Bubalus bubalis]XP_055430408.1 bcl-2-like protein 1 [Bubalus carabanensis]
MSQSNRELVVDFLSYKLSQKGYSWSPFSGMKENRTETPEGRESDMETPSAISGNPSWHLADSPAVNGATGHSRSLDARKMIPMTTVKQALREASNEFKLRCQQTFNDLTSQLHITPGTAYQSFEQDTFVELYENNTTTESQKGQQRFTCWSLTDTTVAGMVLQGLLFNS